MPRESGSIESTCVCFETTYLLGQLPTSAVVTIILSASVYRLAHLRLVVRSGVDSLQPEDPPWAMFLRKDETVR